MNTNITVQTLQRLPRYLNYLKTLQRETNISATLIGEALGINAVVVRKDLDMVSDGGRPKTGYAIQALIDDVEKVLGYDSINNAVLVGVGRLGDALLSYNGFADYGFNIIAGFDIDESVVGKEVNGKRILPLKKLNEICQSLKVRIGIITVPAPAAQSVCDELVKSGVSAIWNFAPTHLNVPEGILVQNENMATSLAMLSRHLNGYQ